MRPGPQLVVTIDGMTRTLSGDALLVAAGRGAAVEGLGLEHTAAEGDRRGLQVDEYLATAEPTMYAAGDVVGLPYGAFTHVARRMGIWAVDNALGLDPHRANADVGPTAIFTDPELAAIGMTEAEARAAGHDVLVGTTGFGGGRARAVGEEYGRVKVVIERGTRRLLGAHVLAYHAADLVNTLAVTMSAPGGTVDPIIDAFHIHPTMGEVVQSVIKETAG